MGEEKVFCKYKRADPIFSSSTYAVFGFNLDNFRILENEWEKFSHIKWKYSAHVWKSSDLFYSDCVLTFDWVIYWFTFEPWNLKLDFQVPLMEVMNRQHEICDLYIHGMAFSLWHIDGFSEPDDLRWRPCSDRNCMITPLDQPNPVCTLYSPPPPNPPSSSAEYCIGIDLK